MAYEEGWEGGGGAMSEDADGEGSQDGEGGTGLERGGDGDVRWGVMWLDRDQAEQQELSWAEGLQQREQHTSKKPRLPGTSPLTSRGGSMQPPPVAGSREEATAAGGADAESGGEGSELQLGKSDQPRSDLPRSRRPQRRAQRTSSAAAVAAEKGAGAEAAAASEGVGPDEELSQRLHALADIAELLGEEAECVPAAPKPVPSSSTHARKHHSPSRTPWQAWPSPNSAACASPGTAVRGSSRLAGAPSLADPLPSHSGQELRGQSPGEEEEGGAGTAKTAGSSRATSAGPEEQQPHEGDPQGALGSASEGAGTGGGRHGSLLYGRPRPTHHLATTAPAAAAAAAAGPCAELVKGEEGSEGDVGQGRGGGAEPLLHLLHALRVLGASSDGISYAEQMLGHRSSRQLEVLQGAALQAVWCTLSLDATSSLPHKDAAPNDVPTLSYALHANAGSCTAGGVVHTGLRCNALLATWGYSAK
ncbi:hypothetical protein DUNSADRAFT_2543 [Dunaliella salina]|uniref:Uncharacterized protein n=1 Tax=Dunaliella salina TaxID=3046 RepID=A0ABQ7FW61_DUNSA|nr:hypothetical protein DUNSADRAFT_2543 [Dunaliella salina]|eukprot:KAF5826611.1 hypothetical protein DUNSADRAFT_2543 [Dunaliella salina]